MISDKAYIQWKENVKNLSDPVLIFNIGYLAAMVDFSKTKKIKAPLV